MRRLIAAVLVLIVSVPAAYALEDTPQNRLEQANRYLKAVPMKDVLAQMLLPVVQATSQADMTKKLEAMLRNIDYAALDNAQRTALVKVFTADELAALADLYSSPAGKSAMLKMGPVMAKMMPLVLPELMRAQAAAVRELAGK